MTAYWISTYVEVRDEQKLAAYAALAGPAITGMGGRFLVRGMPARVYEAGRETRSVVVEFPDVETAVACHDSEAYQQALAALDDGAVRDLRIVPGAE